MVLDARKNFSEAGFTKDEHTGMPMGCMVVVVVLGNRLNLHVRKGWVGCSVQIQPILATVLSVHDKPD